MNYVFAVVCFVSALVMILQEMDNNGVFGWVGGGRDRTRWQETV